MQHIESMKHIFALSLIVTFVCSQTSTNPNDYPFFSPSLVHQLTLDNTPINSTLLESPLDYSDFYWGYVPFNTGVISITLNVPTSCGAPSVLAVINFDGPDGDHSFSFSCDDGSNFLCSNVDSYVETTSGSVDKYFEVGYMQIRPGKNFSITVFQYGENRGQTNCSYSIQANAIFNCPSGTTLAAYGGGKYCKSNTNISIVTENGQSFSGFATLVSEEMDAYRIDVPKNATVVYAWVTSQFTNLYLSASGGFIPLYTDAADFATSLYGGTLASDPSLYTYYLEYYMPDGDFPVFFSVGSYNPYGLPYNISFHWEYCGATKAGYGHAIQNFSDATVTFDYPACSDEVQFTDMNIALGKNYSFSVPAYNNSIGVKGAAYGFLDIPVGTTGVYNLSCISTSQGSFIVISRNQGSDCSGYNLVSLNCHVANPYYGPDTVSLISQDLYSGGYWSFGACNPDNQPANITLVVGGAVSVPGYPSPSPVPSTSASASPSTTSRPLPSFVIDKTKHPTNSGLIAGVVGGVVGLACGIAIIVFLVYRKKKAEKHPSQQNVELQPTQTSSTPTFFPMMPPSREKPQPAASLLHDEAM